MTMAFLNNNPPHQKQVRAILWATPRSTSTSFLTAMSQLVASEVWYEPYFVVRTLGPQRTAQTRASQHHAMKYEEDMNQSGVNIENVLQGGLDSSLYTCDWVKSQLERNLPEKKVVFVKEMIEGIIGQYDAIPDGFQHAFLIRHPLKVFASLRRLIDQTPNKDKKMTDLPISMIPSGYFYKEMCELLSHLRERGDCEVGVIIDTDDLLRNPKGTMMAYCKTIGIPYDPKMLQWSPGEDMMADWKIPKVFLRAFKIGIHNNTFKHSGFGKPSSMPERDSLPEDVQLMADASMPYYDILYHQRLVVD